MGKQPHWLRFHSGGGGGGISTESARVKDDRWPADDAAADARSLALALAAVVGVVAAVVGAAFVHAALAADPNRWTEPNSARNNSATNLVSYLEFIMIS